MLIPASRTPRSVCLQPPAFTSKASGSPPCLSDLLLPPFSVWHFCPLFCLRGFVCLHGASLVILKHLATNLNNNPNRNQYVGNNLTCCAFQNTKCTNITADQTTNVTENPLSNPICPDFSFHMSYHHAALLGHHLKASLLGMGSAHCYGESVCNYILRCFPKAIKSKL